MHKKTEQEHQNASLSWHFAKLNLKIWNKINVAILIGGWGGAYVYTSKFVYLQTQFIGFN